VSMKKPETWIYIFIAPSLKCPSDYVQKHSKFILPLQHSPSVNLDIKFKFNKTLSVL
jgi:hypothetical protein